MGKIDFYVFRQFQTVTQFFAAIGTFDAVETAAKYGIGADRAVNYNADKEGTSIVYESVAKAVCNVRARASLDSSWSDEINEDYLRRGKKHG